MVRSYSSTFVAIGGVCAASLGTTFDIAHSQSAPYRWTISASSTDPFANEAPFSPGEPLYAYLWLQACDLPDPLQDGITAAEFNLVSTNPANVIVFFSPTGGWLNAGGIPDLLLAVGGCPGPMLVATIGIIAYGPGSLCLGPSKNGLTVGVDCSTNPSAWGTEWIGLNFGGGSCGDPGDGPGACCLAGGGCMGGVEAAECAAAGGVFHGPGTTCAVANCPPPPPPVGACCLPDGSCAEGMGQYQCELAEGIFQGAGTLCAGAKCAILAGACCQLDGSCVNGMTQSACQSTGGVFQGAGTECAGVQCSVLTGACCHADGSCVDGMSQYSCSWPLGYFQGPGSTCADAQCSAPGACCLADGSCVNGLEVAACISAGGIFQGPGTSCVVGGCTPISPQPYGWTISASSTLALVNTAPFAPGPMSTYLWFVCGAPTGGMAAATFALVSTNPANHILSFTPTNGFLNAGVGATNLYLAVSGCPPGPVVAGTIVTLVNEPGSICIGPEPSGAMVTINCDPVDPSMHAMRWVGLDFGGGPCTNGVLCPPTISLESRSWSRVKAMYR